LTFEPGEAPGGMTFLDGGRVCMNEISRDLLSKNDLLKEGIVT